MRHIILLCLYLYSASAGSLQYKTCITACNNVAEGCYLKEGKVFGTVTTEEAPASIIMCNGIQGLCMKLCAATQLVIPPKFLQIFNISYDELLEVNNILSTFFKMFGGIIAVTASSYVVIELIDKLYKVMHTLGDTWGDTLSNLYNTTPSSSKWSVLQFTIGPMIAMLGGGILGEGMLLYATYITFLILDDINFDISKLFDVNTLSEKFTSIKNWGSNSIDKIRKFIQ
eukprot:GHVR01036552.1.p1 GENE.GHVR01036552.1~~GHVR01036552.1.p1  ORF type:complete len:228 (+),score=13.72 GHVR01036552.1:26-709(+)